MWGGRSKSKSIYEERRKSIELSRAWSFYLSSSSSLSGTIRPSGHCVPQPPTSTSTSGSILNGLLASSLALSWCVRTILICLMIPDVHLQRSLHLIKSGPCLRSRQAWGPLVYYQRGLHHSHQLLWFSWRRSWCLHKREILAASSMAFIHTATKGCSRVIRFMPRRVGDLQEGQLPESYVPLWVGVLSYVYTFEGNNVP